MTRTKMEGGTSHFLADYSERWAYCITWVFIGEVDTDYIAKSTSSLNLMGPEFYQIARVAPNSLQVLWVLPTKGSLQSAAPL